MNYERGFPDRRVRRHDPTCTPTQHQESGAWQGHAVVIASPTGSGSPRAHVRRTPVSVSLVIHFSILVNFPENGGFPDTEHLLFGVFLCSLIAFNRRRLRFHAEMAGQPMVPSLAEAAEDHAAGDEALGENEQ